MSDACRCGQMRDARGMCPHCDAAARCTPGCVPCATRATYCVICRANCASPAAAQHHEAECRRKEGAR